MAGCCQKCFCLWDTHDAVENVRRLHSEKYNQFWIFLENAENMCYLNKRCDMIAMK